MSDTAYSMGHSKYVVSDKKPCGFEGLGTSWV